MVFMKKPSRAHAKKFVTTMTTTDYIFIILYKTSIYKHDFL